MCTKADCAGAPGDTVLKVWRALLAPDKAAPDQAALAGSLHALRQSGGCEWVVILSRGGHFAAASFNVRPSGRPASGQGKHEAPAFEVLAHKTFHRYVVR